MIILTHILIALISISTASLAFVRPSVLRLRLSYLFVGATLASGTLLVVAAPSHMPSACMSGLAYLAFITVASVATHRKLAGIQE